MVFASKAVSRDGFTGNVSEELSHLMTYRRFRLIALNSSLSGAVSADAPRDRSRWLMTDLHVWHPVRLL